MMDAAAIKSFLRTLVQAARLLFTPLSLSVIFWIIWSSGPTAFDVVADGAWPLLLLAFVLWILANLVSPLITMCLFRHCGARVGYAEALGIHCKRLPAKYLPGGIWHSVGRGADYLARGHTPAQVARYFLAENLVLICVTFAAGALLAGRFIEDDVVRRSTMMAGSLAAIILVLGPLLLRVLTKTAEPAPLKPYLAALLLMALYWVVVGYTFAGFLSAFPLLENARTMTETAGIYVFSWAVGYLAIFAPQGIGVTEAVSGYLLGGARPAAQLLTLLLGFRLLVLAADLACWALLGLRKTSTGIS